MPRTVHLNGSYLPEDQAKVSVFDRGYLFGDGVYEVTAVIDGRLIDYEPHMQRLDRSLRELSMAWPCTRENLRGVHDELLKLNRLREGRVYMQVTRGVAERDFSYPKDTLTSLLAFTQEAQIATNPKAETGVEAVSIPDIRWRRRDIKSIALLPQCMGKEQAAQAGAYEAWMVEDGFVTEGTSSSAYIVTGGRIVTRPLSNAILPGVTRKALLQLSQSEQILVEERPFTLDEAYAAEEAFMSSAGSLVLPIVKLDGRPIGKGAPGPFTRKLRALYLEAARAWVSYR